MALKDETDSADLAIAVKEFVTRLKVLKNERDELNERITDLKEEFKERIDMKTLNNALNYVKIESGIEHKFEFDQIVSILQKEFAVLP